jgi:thiol-disulfide isomerase/thioredoxin
MNLLYKMANCKILLFIICLLCAFSKARGESQRVQSEITISGTIKGLHGKSDTLQIFYYETILDFFTNASKEVDLPIDSSGVFKTTFKVAISNQTRISAVLRTSKLTLIKYGILEPDDLISMDVDLDKKADKVAFSGLSGNKYETLYKLNAIISNQSPEYDEHGTNLLDYDRKMVEGIYTNPAIIYLENHKDSISPLSYQVMKDDVIGQYGEMLNRNLTSLYIHIKKNGKDENYRKSLDSLYIYFLSKVDTSSGKQKALSVYSLDYFKNISQSKVYLQKGRLITLKDDYYQVRSDYSGVLREYLLAELLQFGNRFHISLDSDELHGLWTDAYKLFQLQDLKNFVTHLMAKDKGVGVYAFNFEDTKGKSVKPGDLKGKVVLVDVWFTGCGGCIGYAERLDAKVYPVFKNDKDIVFLSICGDTKRGMWLKSVEEEKYTRKKNLNVYTCGLGFGDPFLKYYGFMGGPYSLLIGKDGKIFNGNPPTDDMEGLITLLNAAKEEKIIGNSSDK